MKSLISICNISVTTSEQLLFTNRPRVTYIEDRIATVEAPNIFSEDALDSNSEDIGSILLAKVTGQAYRQPAGLGKIQEIDLGPDSTKRNIARTKKATQELEHISHNSSLNITDKPTTTLGREGKHRRIKRSRDKEDINRDRLVEEVLRETKCMFMRPFNKCVC